MKPKIKSSILLFLVSILLSFTSEAQTITTIAGGGTVWPGNGQLCTEVQLSFPADLIFDKKGVIYFVEPIYNWIRKIDQNGKVSVFAGIGTPGYSGDGGLAQNAELNNPQGIAIDKNGFIYIADYKNHRVRKVDTSGKISTFAGTGISGYNGDGGFANSAEMDLPVGLAIDSVGNVYISDAGVSVVRKVSNSGLISTIGGNGMLGFSGDGGIATIAKLNSPGDIALDNLGNIYVSDVANLRVRKINNLGIITTIAGIGTSGYNGDGGLAVNSQLTDIGGGIIWDGRGNLMISDYNRIRNVSSEGVITTIAGIGVNGYNGDGMLALSCQLNMPGGLCIDVLGDIYFSDAANHRIRKITYAKNATKLYEDRIKDTQIEFFPNPNCGRFQVRLNKVEKVIVTNILGEELYNCILNPGIHEIDLSGRFYGIHFIRINNNSRIILIQPN